VIFEGSGSQKIATFFESVWGSKARNHYTSQVTAKREKNSKS